MCSHYLWNKRKQSGKSTTLLLCYISLLLVVETIYSVVQARTVELMYIDNRNYPGGPWQYFLDTQNLPVNVMFYATLFTITFLCDLRVVRNSAPQYNPCTLTEQAVLEVLGHLDRLQPHGCICGDSHSFHYAGCIVRCARFHFSLQPSPSYNPEPNSHGNTLDPAVLPPRPFAL